MLFAQATFGDFANLGTLGGMIVHLKEEKIEDISKSLRWTCVVGSIVVADVNGDQLA